MRIRTSDEPIENVCLQESFNIDIGFGAHAANESYDLRNTRTAILLIFFRRHQAEGLTHVLLVDALGERGTRRRGQPVVALHDAVGLIEREHEGLR
jgi:hypothetical protein